MTYIGKILNKDFYFPIENKISIIIGINGSGKTLALKKLKDYFIENNENVIYIPEPENRILKGDPDEIKMIVNNNLNLDLLTSDIKNNFQMDYLTWSLNHLDLYLNHYIDNGYVQIIYFLYNILKVNSGSIVLIDTPEAGLDIMVQHNLLQYLSNLCTVKKIIVCTHSPSLIDKNCDKIVEIEDCVQLYK